MPKSTYNNQSIQKEGNQLKKIISIILLLAVLFSSFNVFAEIKDDKDIAGLLSQLDIMKGDPDGDLRLDDAVSRAEFTKVAIAASKYRDSVATSLTISPFKDVLYTHWAAPYIQLAVSKNLCKGYPDATFNPDGTVLYEEGITMLLKVLGYTDEDFGISWPYGQIGLAKKIGLCDNIDKNAGDTLNRRDVMILLYNLLNTEPKFGGADYIELLDYRIIEDAVLVASTKEDTSVGSDKVYASTGKFYKIDGSFNYDNIGKKGDLVIKDDDKLVSFIPHNQIVNQYSIYQVLGQDIVVLDHGQMKKLGADNSLAVFHKANLSTLQNMLALISPGDVLTTYQNENGVLDYGVLRTDELQGPYTVQSSDVANVLGLSENNLTIIRDGKKASVSEIAVNDIIYYSNALGVIWSYSNKVTGIYENALPNKDMPTSVVVSGVTYNIEGVAAFNKLSSSGSLNYGDTVTLLMGKTKQVADVISPSNTSSEVYGYLFETGKKEFIKSDNSRYTDNYIKVALPDGGVYEYKANRDYKDLKNSIVRVTFENGVAKASQESRQSSVSGNFDWEAKRLGNNKLASDVDILDVTTPASNNVGNYTKIFPQRVDGLTLSMSNILYADKNANGEISTLILDDVTGDAYAYGILTKATKTTAGAANSYTIDTNGNTKVYVSTTVYSPDSGQPCKFTLTSTGIDTMQGLSIINDPISAVTTSYLTAGNGKYLISDKVVVYKKTPDFGYMVMPLQDIVGSDAYNLIAYCDKPTKDGGRVRIIIATEK